MFALLIASCRSESPANIGAKCLGPQPEENGNVTLLCRARDKMGTRRVPFIRLHSRQGGTSQALIDLILRLRRATFRLAAFACITPFEAPRMISGWASRRAAFAAAWSPLSIADSTFRKNVRMRDRRILLTAVLRAIFRTRFLAAGEFAMCAVHISGKTKRGHSGFNWARQRAAASRPRKHRTLWHCRSSSPCAMQAQRCPFR